METVGPLILLPVAITLLLLIGPRHGIIYAVVCAIALLALPFIYRFRIEISPRSLKLRIKYLGIVKESIEVPLDKVLIKHNGFRDINEARYEDYSKNEKDYLALEYDNGWDGAVDYTSVYFNGKEIVFSTEQRKFEAELWDLLTTAIKATYLILQQEDLKK